MALSDPIADMLTRIRNAGGTGMTRADIPASNTKIRIAQVLRDEGYIASFKLIRDGKQGILRVYLKYTPDGEHVIMGIQRVSKPGRRNYAGKEEIPRILSGLGTAIMTTSQGVMTGQEARRRGIGGEVICKVW